MAKPFEQRNQTDTARRKLKSLAKASCIDIDLVSALANFTWDYDPQYGNEAIGWVSNGTLSRAAKEQLHGIAESVSLSPDFKLQQDQAVKNLIQAREHMSAATLWANFCDAAVTKNYGRVSEFASHHYLHGINVSRAQLLAWKGKGVGMVDIARNLFLKLFRGGTIERYDLAYLWCDLLIPLPYADSKLSKPVLWVEKLLACIELLPKNSGLKDLIDCCKGLVGGDKSFKQEILQSLAYADVVRVTGLPVREMFIAEHRDELSPHFYSNEWTFPLRFWSANGGTINRAAIPSLDTE